MRAFIAIKLDLKVIHDLVRIQQELRSRIKGMRWVKPELLHITLKFLGEVKEEDIILLEKPLRELGGRTASFNLSFSSLGAFPQQKDPRVIWLGVEEGVRELHAFSREMERLFPAGGALHNPGKPKFKAHLTLGRRNKHEKLELHAHVFEERWVCGNTMDVKEFYLMQSTLYPSGPVYSPLKKFSLK